MKFVFDPPILDKIARMQQRVRWQDVAFKARQIDQTHLYIDDARANSSTFSFLVVGDSGSNQSKSYNPQNQIAQIMLQHQHEINFILHTGDVVYEVGSREYYRQNFITPYRGFIAVDKTSDKIAYDRLTFQKPFLPVPGNHDYYDLPLSYALAAKTVKLINWLTNSHSRLNIGWQGSDIGDTYARAFLDCTAELTSEELARHLDFYYIAKFKNKRCLNYQPHYFTRLPNRYYSFRYGNIDFIALDSNTFKASTPIADTLEGTRMREQLIAQLDLLDEEYKQLKAKSEKLDLGNPLQQDLMNDYQAHIYQIQQKQQEIKSKLESKEKAIDYEQLNWFKDRLVSSWLDSEVTGRVLYLHHSPYTTEVTKNSLEETLEVRHHLRQILDEVSLTLRNYNRGRPLLDLVISGHAHCFEHLYTLDTGHADSKINWLICGGGGRSVRRQQSGNTIVTEIQNGKTKQVAQSRLFLGCKGYGVYKKQSYSCLRIDVENSNPPKFYVRPLVAEQAYQKWYHYQPDSFVINS